MNMSVERLEIIKQQIVALSRHEQVELSRFLAEQMSKDKAPPAMEPARSNIEVADETGRARNMEWMKANDEEFGGQYIALENGSLVATGRTLREARAASRAAGKPNAFITYLPKPDEGLETGGWL
jgi:Family of unknown function (DUF5678)